MAKLDSSVSSCVRFFAFWLANGTACNSLKDDNGNRLEYIDYQDCMDDPSFLEQVFAIYLNVIEVNENGKVTDAGAAKNRAAQYIRHYVDSTYKVIPPFESWELELH